MFALRFVLLFLTWCCFSGLFDPFHLSLGVLSSLWVSAVSTQIALSRSSASSSLGPVALFFGLISYIAWLLVEIFKANLQVMKLSIASSPEDRLSPTVVEFRTRLAGDFSRFLLAHSITLTPGTVTVRVDGDRFIVHALTEQMAEGVPGDMETKLLRLFGDQQEQQLA